MYFESNLLLLLSVTIFCLDNSASKRLLANDVADKLVELFEINNNTVENYRFKELKEKIDTIDNYVIDKEKYAAVLTNETYTTNLNETNFLKSLINDDYFRSFIQEEPKSLYLRLKEKMTRDDILQIIAKHEQETSLVTSARRTLDLGDNPMESEVLDEVVDKLIAEIPNDNHKYDDKDVRSNYWDPQVELEELRDHHRHDGRRIFKGERTTVRYYPFMATIHIMNRFWCGGVLYWNDLVLTSASCLQLMHNNRFFRENPRVLDVRIGSNHSRIGGEMVSALEVYFHPDYNPRTLLNNLAVIRLRRHVKFTYHRVPKLIDISHEEGGLANTAEVLILGWGVTKTSQKMHYEPVFMQRKFLPVYPNIFCKEIYGEKFVSKTMFCAGTFSTGEGACDHDAGGPAVRSGKLVGIISYGPSVCGYPNMPTVFTLVGAYSDWIETIKENMPDYYRGKARTTSTTPFPYKFLRKLPEKKKTLITPLTKKPTAADEGVAGEASPADNTAASPVVRTDTVTDTVASDATTTLSSLPPAPPAVLRLMGGNSETDEDWEVQ